jgi:hypothetical protein
MPGANKARDGRTTTRLRTSRTGTGTLSRMEGTILARHEMPGKAAIRIRPGGYGTNDNPIVSSGTGGFIT